MNKVKIAILQYL